MLKRLSESVTEILIRREWIPDEKRYICRYCLELCFYRYLFIVLLLLVSYATKAYLQVMIYSLVLFRLRKCMGGWHANSAFACEVLGLCIVIISVEIIGPLFENLQVAHLFAFAILLDVVALFLKLAFPPQLHLTTSEKDAILKEKMYTILILAVIQSIGCVCEKTIIVLYSSLATESAIILVLFQLLKERRKK